MAYNFKNNLSPVYMSNTYNPNSSPLLRTKRSVDSFIDQIYEKEISGKLVSHLAD